MWGVVKTCKSTMLCLTLSSGSANIGPSLELKWIGREGTQLLFIRLDSNEKSISNKRRRQRSKRRRKRKKPDQSFCCCMEAVYSGPITSLGVVSRKATCQLTWKEDLRTICRFFYSKAQKQKPSQRMPVVSIGKRADVWRGSTIPAFSYHLCLQGRSNTHGV